ncbi:unnamed protein product [Adineta ricciae]|uniref:Carbonic anhydrase n=1 Tax=Adineta ricciae TaxID=249248 RepID=A0A814HTZ0_ADIRI|nr:unnamed protein product [Adineta ricciae]CAF1174814.1 unnamed protein product [Adineta ricciae]
MSSFTILLQQSYASQWNYGDLGPDVWSDFYSICGRRAQSPINIRTPCTVFQSFKVFTFSSAYTQTRKFKLLNNGHTIVGTYIDTNRSSPYELNGGGLNGTFKLTNFHLHWGENYKSGSEHRVNGQKYSGEMHIVHTNLKTGQMAVLGMFIQSITVTSVDQSEKDEDGQSLRLVEWQKYLSVIKNLQNVGDFIEADLNLSWLESHNLNDFWRYRGSLTTPPCIEDIIWTVFRAPIIVKDGEFQVLRHDILIKDFREPQPLNGRQVLQSFKSKDQPSKGDYQRCLIE